MTKYFYFIVILSISYLNLYLLIWWNNGGAKTLQKNVLPLKFQYRIINLLIMVDFKNLKTLKNHVDK